ncbi:hypothetical protein Tco_1459221 [Tanacetum coccineum]
MGFLLSLRPLMEETRLSLQPPLEDISNSKIRKVYPNTFKQTTKTTIASYQNLFPSHTYKQTVQQHEESIQGIPMVVTPLFDTMLVQPQDEAPSISPSRITSSPSLSSYNTPPNTPNTPPSFQTTHEAEETATMPHDSPLPGGHTPGSDEGRLKYNELMELVTKLSDKVVAVEEDMKQTKKTYSTAFTKLVLKVKKLEKQVRSSKARRRARIVLSEDEDAAEDPSKQGRKIAQIDTDPTISLEISTADVPVSTAGAEVSIVSHDVSTAAAALVKLNEREEVPAEATQLQTINWSDPAVLRYHALQNRSYSIAKVRKNIVMYLKGYKQSYFKGMKYEEIRPIFEKVWDQTHTFVPMDTEDKEKGTEKKSRGTRKKTLARKRAGEKKSEDNSKRQKNEDVAADYEQEKAELRLWLKVAQDDEEYVNPEILSTKYPIVDWEYQSLGQVGGKDFEVYKLTRADGSVSYHGNIQAFLRRLDREDLSTLYRLVQERFQDHPLEGRDLLLWGDLRMIFDLDEKDDIWMNQLDWKLLKWKLHENYGVHTLFMDGTPMQINMLIEKKYPLIKVLLEKMLNLQLEAEEESTMAFELLKFIKSQIEEQ